MNQNNFEQDDSKLLDVTGKDIAELLDTHANRLSLRTLKQLENARQRAVNIHARRLAGGHVNSDGTLDGLFGWMGHHRAAMAGMAAVSVMAGVMALNVLKPSVNTDALLLSAELPPEAFVDRGFEPSLNRPVQFEENTGSSVIKL